MVVRAINPRKLYKDGFLETMSPLFSIYNRTNNSFIASFCSSLLISPSRYQMENDLDATDKWTRGIKIMQTPNCGHR